MKKTLLLFSFLPLFSFAQQPVEPGDVVILPLPVPKNEIGINLFSATNFQDLYMGDWFERVDINPPSGVYYKRHFGQNALRASFDYTRHSLKVGEYPSEIYYDTYFSATRQDLTIGLGYERSFGAGRFQPYVFSDLVFNYEKQEGERVMLGCFGPFGLLPFSQESYQTGIASGAGFRYKLTPALHVSYEFAVQGYVSYTKDLSHLYPGYPAYTYREYGHRLNPVNKFGLAFAF
jgi:hypothetical protein